MGAQRASRGLGTPCSGQHDLGGMEHAAGAVGDAEAGILRRKEDWRMSEHITRAVIQWLQERHPGLAPEAAIVFLSRKEQERLREFITLASRCPTVARVLTQRVDQAATHAPAKRARRKTTRIDHQTLQASQSAP